MKYWEIIADKLPKPDGFEAACQPGRTIWIADAHRDWKR